jgi:hypothetical protein
MKRTLILLAAVLFTAMSTMAQVAINKDDSNPTAGTIMHVKGDTTNNKVILEDISQGLQIGDYTLPATDGTADQTLTTDGSGAVAWAAATDGTGSNIAGSAGIGANYGSVVNNTTGKVWLDRNLGATQVATSSTHAAAYGDLYQWGRAADGHQVRTSDTDLNLATTWIADDASNAWDGEFILNPGVNPELSYDWLVTAQDDLWSGTAAENNPCPSGYRLPTNAELNQERLSWVSNNAAGAFGSVLKLTLAGLRNSSGSLQGVGSNGYYWSSTVSGELARFLYISSSIDAYVSALDRVYGFSVRCIKD